MIRYVVLSGRLLLVLGFLLGMPVLALPPVARWCEAQLYPPPAKRRIVAARLLAGVAEKAIVIGERTALPWIEQASYQEEAEVPPAAAEPAAPDLNALAATVRSLGATFYRLEQVPEGAGAYRFTAEFETPGAVPTRAHYTATAVEPADAIQSVIDQIRAGR